VSTQSVIFPDDLAALHDGWTHIKLVGHAYVMYLGSEQQVSIRSFPSNLTELSLRGTGHQSLSLTPVPEKNLFAGHSMFFKYKLVEELPESLTRVKYISGAQAHYPLSFLPTSITELKFENHVVNSDTLKQLQRFTELRVLEIASEGLHIQDEDVRLLPRSLRVLRLGTDRLSTAALPHFPPSLTEVVLGAKSQLAGQAVLEACAARLAPNNG
jgi:hypothetical protein